MNQKARSTLRVAVMALATAACSTSVSAQETRATGLEPPSEEELRKATVASIPPSFGGPQVTAPFSLRSELPVPQDQGRTNNTCVAWSVGYALMTYMKHLYPGAVLSPEYLYHYCLAKTPPPPDANKANSGDYNRNVPVKFDLAFQVLKDHGICDRKLWSKWAAPPSPVAETDARKFRTSLTTVILQSSDQFTIKSYLQQGKPLPAGIFIDKAFSTDTGDFEEKNGKPVWTKFRDSLRSPHAMLVVGFDDNIQAYEVMNSFGAGWGDKGFVWIDYDQFARATLVLYGYEVDPGAFGGGVVQKPITEASTPSTVMSTPSTPTSTASTLSTTSTTSTEGTITTFEPGQTIVVRRVGVNDPSTYTLAKSVEYVNNTGKTIEASMIKPGVPVKVYYDHTHDTQTVARVVVGPKLYCRLAVKDAEGRIERPTLAFDISADESGIASIHRDSILTRSAAVPALKLRRQTSVGGPSWAEPAGILLPGDQMRVSELKAYKIANGETHYWIGGDVIKKAKN